MAANALKRRTACREQAPGRRAGRYLCKRPVACFVIAGRGRQKKTRRSCNSVEVRGIPKSRPFLRPAASVTPMSVDSPHPLAPEPAVTPLHALAAHELQSDERLMADYAAGDADALARIFDRYAPLLLNVLRRRMSERDEVQDLIQQTFLQVHRARADFDPSRRFRPWLFSIALNVQREHFRARRRRVETDLSELAAVGSSVDTARAEAAWDIERALPRLSPEQREVVELHWLADLTFPEVAAIVGATVTATRVRAHRAYARLRSLLDEATRDADYVALRGRGPY